MPRDTFKTAPTLQKLLQPRDAGLKGVPSPHDLVAFRQRRPSRKVVEAKKVLELINEPTNPEFAYDDTRSFFAKLAEGARVASGWGAEIMDPERTVTQVA